MYAKFFHPSDPTTPRFYRGVMRGHGQSVFSEAVELRPGVPTRVWDGNIGPDDNTETVCLSLPELEAHAAETDRKIGAGGLTDWETRTHRVMEWQFHHDCATKST